MSFEALKNKGNDILSKATDKIPNLIYLERCDEAIEVYKKAVSSTLKDNEIAMCFKNIGFAYLKKHCRYESAYSALKNLELCIFYYKEALKHGKKGGKDGNWISDIQNKVQEVLFKILETSKEANYEQRIKVLINLYNNSEDENFTIEICLNITRATFKESIRLLECKNPIKAKKILYDDLQFVERGIFLAKKKFDIMASYLDELEEKREDFMFNLH